MRIWEPQAGARKNIFSKKHDFGYHQTDPQNLHLFGQLYFCISCGSSLKTSPANHAHQANFQVTARSNPIIWDFHWNLPTAQQASYVRNFRYRHRATVMRADTASITTPAKPERNFAVTTAIVPVTTAIAQSKKMKISLGIGKNVEKNKRNNEKETNKTKKT